MSEDTILTVAANAILTVMTIAGPPLIIGLSVGILVSIFQAVTSIQEPTLAFVPKILAVLAAILFFGSFMVTTLTDFMTNLYTDIPNMIIPR